MKKKRGHEDTQRSTKIHEEEEKKISHECTNEEKKKIATPARMKKE